MKKKKPLQNPVVVIALCAVAGAALYFNTIAPLLKGDEEYYSAEETEEIPVETVEDANEESVDAVMESVPEGAVPPVPPPVQTGQSVNETSAQNNATTESALYAMQWHRKTDRNPFVHPKKRGLTDTVPKTGEKEQPQGSKATAAKKRKVLKRSWKKVRNTTREPQQPPVPLYAISRGPSGWFALIGSEMVRVGDTCSVGVIAAIDRTSITVRKYGKLRIVTLKNRNRE
jgi:hypothetical protein